LSVFSLAREIAALYNLKWKMLLHRLLIAASTATLNVDIEHKNACPLYTGRIIENLNTLAETP
jgi:phenylalanyl-tRNA synthetase beta subunit